MKLTHDSAVKAFEMIAKYIEDHGLSHNYDADRGAIVVLPYIWKELQLDKLIVPDDCGFIYIGLSAGNYIEIDSRSNGSTVISRPAGIHRIVEQVSNAGYIEIELFKPNSYMDDENSRYMFNGWQVRACTSD